MTSMEVGSYGATRQSWRSKNPRDALKKLIDSNPTSDQLELLNEFEKIARSDDGYLSVIIEYWFTNNFRSLTTHSVVDAKRQRAKLAKASAHLTKKIKEKVEIELLKLIMPNGKPLAQCTGLECVKFGGWLSNIGKRVGAKNVGDVLTESELRDLR
jgi:hypothetical protein